MKERIKEGMDKEYKKGRKKQNKSIADVTKQKRAAKRKQERKER